MMQNNVRRGFGMFALSGVIAFAVVCGAAQFLRPDLDWIATPLSFYLIGAGGAVLKAAYLLLSTAIAALAVGVYRDLPMQARSSAPLLLFLVAAVALTITALAETDAYRGDQSMHGLIHGLAAQTTFLCVTAAMLLQSLRLRLAPRWQPAFVPMLVLAAVTFAALWVNILVRSLPRGVLQKTVIVLILLWLVRIAFALCARPAAGASRD